MKLPRKAGKPKVPPAVMGAVGGLVAGAGLATALALKGRDLALKGAAWVERKTSP